MRKEVINNIFLCLSVCLLVSCSSNPVRERIEKELTTNSDTLIKVMPVRMQDSSDIKVLHDAQVRTLGLPSLEKGATKFQLRIWQSFENRRGRLIILTTTNNNNSSWSAELYTYKFVSSGTFRPDSLTGQEFPLKEPKSGWNNLLNKLLDLEILSLPDFQLISNYDVPADATGVSIEIAKPKYYRFYEYPEPYFQQNKIPQAKKIVQILELIRKEFELNKQ